jgi:hypothetical protein
MNEKRTYVTDGIHEFIAFHGFEEAVCIVSKVLKISITDSKKRILIA